MAAQRLWFDPKLGLNVFTNYFNLVTRPVVDFPEIAPGLTAAA